MKRKKIEIEVSERDYEFLSSIGGADDPIAVVRRLATMAASCVEVSYARAGKPPAWAMYWLRDAGLEVKTRSPRLIREGIDEVRDEAKKAEPDIR